MWSGTLHDKEFTTRLLITSRARRPNYGTFSRMKGMITLAVEVRFKYGIPLKLNDMLQEIDTRLIFTPSKVAGFFTASPHPLKRLRESIYFCVSIIKLTV